MKPVLEQISDLLREQAENTVKFKRQLIGLLEEREQVQLIERIQKGTEYYKGVLCTMIRLLLRHVEEMKKQKRVKTYVTHLTDLDQLFAKKLESVDKAMLLIAGIIEGRDSFDFNKLTQERILERAKLVDEIRAQVGSAPVHEKKSRRVPGSKKKAKGETQEITLKLLESGLSVEGIAKERGLVIGTIESHLAKAVGDKRISIFKFMPEEIVTTIAQSIKEMGEEFSSKELFAKLNGKFNYGQLRAVMNHLGIKSTKL